MSRFETLALVLACALLVVVGVYLFVADAADPEPRLDEVTLVEAADTAASSRARRDATVAAHEVRGSRAATGPVAVGGAGLRGRVVHEVTAAPLADVLIELLVDEVSGDILAARSDPYGGFSFTGLAASDRAFVSLRRAGLGTRVLGPLSLVPASSLDLGTIALGPGSGITGDVRDQSGRPVPGATVTLRPLVPPASINELLLDLGRLFHDLPAVARTESDADGSYRIEGVPAGHYHVSVVAVGFADHHQVDLWVNARGFGTRQDFDLRPESILSGRVLTADGVPVAAARLCVLPGLAGRDLSIIVQRAATTTDAAGAFEVRGLQAGPAEILVAPAAGAFRTATKVEVPQRDVELRIASGVAVWGLALRASTGKPIADARLSFVGPGAFFYARTDAEGSYRTGPLPAGKWTIAASVPGLVARPADIALELRGREDRHHDVVFVAGATFTGRVLDQDDGEPIAGAEVAAAERWGIGTSIVKTTSDARGAFRLEGAALDRVRVLARADGYTFDPEAQARSQHLYQDLTPGEIVTDVDVRLHRELVITGTITAARAPVVGARVSTTLEGEFQSAMLGSRTYDASSDEVGRFRVRAGDPGETGLRLYVRHPDYASAEVLVATPGTDARTVEQDVALVGGALVRGEVRAPDGRPLAAVGVRARPTGASMGARSRAVAERFGLVTRTDEAGRYRLRLPPGAVNLVIDSDRHVALGPALELDLVDGASANPEPLVATPSESIAGSVAATQNADRVVAVRRDADGYKWTGTARIADDRFELRGLPAGSYDLYLLPRNVALSALAQLTPNRTGVATGGEPVEL